MGSSSKPLREKIVGGQPSTAVRRVHPFQRSGTPWVNEMDLTTNLSGEHPKMPARRRVARQDLLAPSEWKVFWVLSQRNPLNVAEISRELARHDPDFSLSENTIRTYVKRLEQKGCREAPRPASRIDPMGSVHPLHREKSHPVPSLEADIFTYF